MIDRADTKTELENDPAPADDDATVVVTTATSAPPLQVWDALVHRTASWWGEAYLGPDAGAMRLEPRLGGRVYSGRDADSGSLHGTIRAFDPPGRLAIGGVLVPGAYAGDIVITVEKSNLGSEIRVEHTARGRIDASVEDRILHGWTKMATALAEVAER